MQINRSAHVDQEALRGLHPSAIEDSVKIAELLNRARVEELELTRGLNHKLSVETARIRLISNEALLLETSGFRRNNRRQIFLNFDIGHRKYFFSTEAVGAYKGDLLEVAYPRTIFSAERRDRARRRPGPSESALSVTSESGTRISCRVEDVSQGGIGITVPASDWNDTWRSLEIAYQSRSASKKRAFASVRSVEDTLDVGWKRIGLVESSVPMGSPIHVERWETITQGLRTLVKRTEKKVSAQSSSDTASFVEFNDRRGRTIAGFLDRNDAPGETIAVILQTGWGETKESLLPLARTIVDTFSAYNRSVVVLRMDGVNQRGESYKDPECRVPGREFNNFGFSQPVLDIEAASNFLRTSVKPIHTTLVSQSIAALAGRKYISNDSARTIDAWVCLVGAPDLQSASRSISGGIDFAVGYESGLEFGYQELLGVTIHADRMLADAVDVGVLYLSDARNDFASISIPVTWLHGRFDGWVDLARVEDIMSYGPAEDRRLITLPIAHRLGWSGAAFETFGLVANEISRLALGTAFEPNRPDSNDLATRRAWERQRRPRPESDLRKFWKDYLLGRDESIGFELLTASDPYAMLMAEQIDRLELSEGNRILDLGCGTGGLTDAISRCTPGTDHLTVVGLDHIPEALKRARSRTTSQSRQNGTNSHWVASDLDIVEGQLGIPVASSSFDGVVASLFLSYIERPVTLLRDAFRLLRPGGRMVVSSLIKDADISRLFEESLSELRVGDARDRLPEMQDYPLDSIARNFLNDAARILDLEADGAFIFWEPAELVELLESAGFVEVDYTTTFGYPGQAVVLSARKPAE